MAKEPSYLKKKIIFKKFVITKLLATSEFAWVYEGKNVNKNIPVAIKIEKKDKYNLLESEAYILMGIKGFGIPQIISFGKCGPFKILIEELLGKDLLNIWKSVPFKKDPWGHNNTFIKDICLLAIQGIERLKYIHEKNVIHRDIKPKNFLIGRNNPNDIYLIDFGFSKKYRSSRTGKHIKFSKTNMLYGSLNFSSLNSIKGYEYSRRDDLESFGYMLIYLAKGGCLPWKICEILGDKNENIKNIIKIKLRTTNENLCKGLPNEFIQYIKYVKKLDFEQEPNYQYLTGLFTSILSKDVMKKHLTFFWVKQKQPQIKKNPQLVTSENKQDTSISKTIERNSSRTNTRNRLYNKIKEILNLNLTEKTNKTKNYFNNETKTINVEKKNNLVTVGFNFKANNLNTKSIENFKISNNYKTMTEIGLSNLEKNKAYNNSIQILDIKKNKFLTKMNLINNSNLLFKKYTLKKKNKNSIKPMNFAFNNNQNISFYNNINYKRIYFINQNSVSALNKTTDGSRLNSSSNENYLFRNKSINDLNLKRNNIYKPKFKKI